MKNNLIIFLFALALLACGKDPCSGVECLNAGICLEGHCDCPEGFIGPDCGIALDPCVNKDCDLARTDSCQMISSTEARCICKQGFEGERCERRWEDKFIASYSCMENCNGTQLTFNVAIVDGPDPRTLAIENFHNQTGVATKVVAELLSAEVLDMSQQYMAYGLVNGGGTLESDGSIGMSYQIITATPDTLLCSALLSPQ